MEKSIVDLTDYKIIKQLIKDQEGAFGQIFIVESKKTKEQFVAKVSKVRFTTGKSQRQFFIKVKILRKAKHPAILGFSGFSLTDFEEEFCPTILTPLMKNGSLRSVFDKEYRRLGNHGWTVSKKEICLVGLAIGLKALHERNIIHYNIKPENILLDDQFYPKICDFGVSKVILDFDNNQMSTAIGTPLYMAPEISEGEYSSAVDVYSFSFVAYELFSFQPPKIEAKNAFHLANQIQRGVRPDLKAVPKEKQRQFLKRCWSAEPEERPTFTKIVEELINDKDLWVQGAEEGSEEVEEYLLQYNLPFRRVRKQKTETKKKIVRVEEEEYEEEEEEEEEEEDDYEEDDYEVEEEVENMLKPGNIPNYRNLSAENKKLVNRAIRGDSSAMLSVANKLCDGKNGFLKDIPESIKYYKQAIKKGDASAMYNYGLMLKNGEGVVQNYPEAIKYFNQAIEKGSASAMNSYALMLQKGIGVEQNYIEAIKYFNQAIEKGNDLAMFNYASILESGFGFVQPNLKLALKYYKMNADTGDPNGERKFKELINKYA